MSVILQQRDASSIKITPLRISTMTVTGHLGTKINIPKLWDGIPIQPYWYLGEGILKMEHNMNKKGIARADILLKRKKPKKKFFNQATVVVRIVTGPATWKEVNIKLFSNGGTQMTGILYEDMGRKAIDVFLGALRASLTEDKFKEIFEIEPKLERHTTQLVNSDYSIGAPIRRDRLHKILVQQYKLFSTFESDIYQGVNTKYFVNKQRPATVMPGLCGCPSLCAGSGNGNEVGSCKSVTIAPFQTGKLIITGARTLEQIEEAYEYVNKIILAHAEEILRPLPPTRPAAAAGTIVAEKVITAAAAKKADRWVQHPSPRQCQEFLASLICG